MAKSKTEICNLAVSWLGGTKIMSVNDDDSFSARLCRANYDMSRKAVLEEREWTFAVTRGVLTPLLDAPSFGYNYKFLVPPDFLRIIGVYNPSHSGAINPPMEQHLIEGNKILANISEINVKAVFDVTNTTMFSSLFDQALAAHVAMNIAIPLTESKQMLEDMKFLYEDKLQKAISSDSLQGSRERLETSQLENSRRMFVRPS